MEDDERKTGWREERSRSRDGKQYVTKNKVQKKEKKRRGSKKDTRHQEKHNMERGKENRE